MGWIRGILMSREYEEIKIEGFQCDLWDYCFDDLEDIAEQLYNKMNGNIADIRIE